MTNLKIDDENKFEYLFLAIGPCILGYVSCCKLVIEIVGTHLKGKYMGVMVVATTMDGNEQNFPLAFDLAMRRIIGHRLGF